MIFFKTFIKKSIISIIFTPNLILSIIKIPSKNQKYEKKKKKKNSLTKKKN